MGLLDKHLHARLRVHQGRPLAAMLSYRCKHAATHTSPAPPTRTGHSATRLGEEVLIFGGMVDGECSAELLSLHLPPMLA